MRRSRRRRVKQHSNNKKYKREQDKHIHINRVRLYIYIYVLLIRYIIYQFHCACKWMRIEVCPWDACYLDTESKIHWVFARGEGTARETNTTTQLFFVFDCLVKGQQQPTKATQHQKLFIIYYFLFTCMWLFSSRYFLHKPISIMCKVRRFFPLPMRKLSGLISRWR